MSRFSLYGQGFLIALLIVASSPSVTARRKCSTGTNSDGRCPQGKVSIAAIWAVILSIVGFASFCISLAICIRRRNARRTMGIDYLSHTEALWRPPATMPPQVEVRLPTGLSSSSLSPPPYPSEQTRANPFAESVTQLPPPAYTKATVDSPPPFLSVYGR